MKVRNGYYLVLLRQIFISEVSLERGKFPLQDYIYNSKKNFFLRHKSGFRVVGHIWIILRIKYNVLRIQISYGLSFTTLNTCLHVHEY